MYDPDLLDENTDTPEQLMQTALLDECAAVDLYQEELLLELEQAQAELAYSARSIALSATTQTEE